MPDTRHGYRIDYDAPDVVDLMRQIRTRASHESGGELLLPGGDGDPSGEDPAGGEGDPDDDGAGPNDDGGNPVGGSGGAPSMCGVGMIPLLLLTCWGWLVLRFHA